MTHRVDGFVPKVVWKLVLIHHGPTHVHKSPVLPVRYTIFLRGVRCRILVLNPIITKNFFHGVVLELLAIVASNCQDICIETVLRLLGKINECFLHLILG